MINFKKYSYWSPLFLRFGLGLVFLWPSISKLFAKVDALGVCTNRQEAIDLVASFWWLPIPPDIFVTIQSWLELALGILLVVGIGVDLAAVVAVLLFVSFFVFLDFDLVWKNMALLGAAAALLLLPADKWRIKFKNHKEISQTNFL